MNNSDKALIITTTLMIVFVSAVFLFLWFDKTVPDSLIFCVLGSGTTEFGICGWIYSIKKDSKTKTKKKSKTKKKTESKK